MQALDEVMSFIMTSKKKVLCMRLETFWRQVQDQPWASGMVWCTDDFHKKVIPIKIFGDCIAALGVGKSWSKSMEAFTIMPLLTKISSKYSTLVLALLWKHFLTEEMIRKTWCTLAWSLNALQHGVHPTRNWNGVMFPEGSPERAKAGLPLAGGYKAAVVAIQVDCMGVGSGMLRIASLKNNLVIFFLGHDHQSQWHNFGAVLQVVVLFLGGFHVSCRVFASLCPTLGELKFEKPCGGNKGLNLSKCKIFQWVANTSPLAWWISKLNIFGLVIGEIVEGNAIFWNLSIVARLTKVVDGMSGEEQHIWLS